MMMNKFVYCTIGEIPTYRGFNSQSEFGTDWLTYDTSQTQKETDWKMDNLLKLTNYDFNLSKVIAYGPIAGIRKNISQDKMPEFYYLLSVLEVDNPVKRLVVISHSNENMKTLHEKMNKLTPLKKMEFKSLCFNQSYSIHVFAMPFLITPGNKTREDVKIQMWNFAVNSIAKDDSTVTIMNDDRPKKRARKCSKEEIPHSLGEFIINSAVTTISDNRRKKIKAHQTYACGNIKPIAPIYPPLNIPTFHDFDYDIAKDDNSFAHELEPDNLVLRIGEIKKKLLDNKYSNTDVDRVLGAIASNFYELLDWKLKSPVPLKFEDMKFKEPSTIDIDQVSLCVNKINTNSSHIFNQFKNNNEFLLFFYKKLVEKVFDHNGAPLNPVTLNYQEFLNGIQKYRGGHTYMTAKMRAAYMPFYVDSSCEVIKVSLAFSSKAKSLDSLKDNNYLNEVCQDMRIENWSKLNNKDKIWHANLLVVKWLLNLSPEANHSSKLTYDCFDGFKNNRTIICYRGVLVPLLACLQVALLEYKSQSICFTNIALETYGGKSRTTQRVDLGKRDKDYSEDIRCLLEKNLKQTTTIISKFSYFFAEVMEIKDIKSNKLIWGLGCTVCTEDIKCIPLYPVINIIKCPYLSSKTNTNSSKSSNNIKRKRQCEETEGSDNANNKTSSEEEENDKDYIQIEDYENIHYDSEDDQNVAESKMIENILVLSKKIEKPTTILEQFKKLGKYCNYYTPYCIYGRILPIELQPHTVNFPVRDPYIIDEVKVLRVQHYSVSARKPMGDECTVVSSTSKAGFPMLELGKENIHDTDGKSKHVFDFESLYRRHAEFNDYLRKNMELLRTNGNIARIEIAIVSENFQFMDNTVIKGLNGLIDRVKSCVESYRIEEITILIEFFALALFHRIQLICQPITGLFRDYNDIAPIVTEVAAYVRDFYTGKNMLTSKYICAKKASFAGCRPILSPLPKTSNESNLKYLQCKFSSINWWILFCNSVGIPSKSNVDIGIEMRSFKFAYVEEWHCSCCFRIFSNDRAKQSFGDHPCLLNHPKFSLMKVRDVKFKTHISSEYKNLSCSQKKFVYNVWRRESCAFLTGCAGAGKSRTLRNAIGHLLLWYGRYVTAVTSIVKNAADIVGGSTLHSFFCLQHSDDFHTIGIETFFQRLNERKDKYIEIQNYLQFLIIDECSLLTGKGLDTIDQVLKKIKSNFNKPFGGVKVILCGDVMQLPPIIKTINGNVEQRFFFQSQVFTEPGAFKVHYLKKVFRQKNEDYIAILNRIRYGELTDSDLEVINSEWGNSVPYDVAEHVKNQLSELYDSSEAESLEMKHRLFQHGDRIGGKQNKCRQTKLNDHFQRLNKREGLINAGTIGDNYVICIENIEINFLSNESSQPSTKVIIAVDKRSDNGKITSEQRNTLTEETKLLASISLYEGKRISFSANDTNIFAANNSMGIVNEIKTECIKVTLISKNTNIENKTIDVKKKTVSINCEGGFTISRSQFPLKDGNIGNPYTVQGITLDSIPTIFNNERIAKDAAGAAYVVFSRFTDPRYIFPLHPITNFDIHAHPIAKEFDKFYNSSEKDVVEVNYKSCSYNRR